MQSEEPETPKPMLLGKNEKVVKTEMRLK